MNHAFVSSSTRENSTLAQALRHFGAEHHEKLLEAARSAGLEVQPGIGHWEDGAEETAHLKGPNAADVGEQLGRDFGQKSVLLFSETPHGPDRLHRFETRDPKRIRKHLSPFLTTTPEGTHVVETEATQEFLDKAKALGYPHSFVQGKAVFRETK